MSNKPRGVLYTGVTSDLVQRVWQHKNHAVSGFTDKYNVDKLGCYEQFSSIEDAIAREKQLKAGSRRKKISLIEAMNPSWRDLYSDILQ